jgi:hypothetical protein
MIATPSPMLRAARDQRSSFVVSSVGIRRVCSIALTRARARSRSVPPPRDSSSASCRSHGSSGGGTAFLGARAVVRGFVTCFDLDAVFFFFLVVIAHLPWDLGWRTASIMQHRGELVP